VKKDSALKTKPGKALGQHFLADNRVLTRIVSAAAIGPVDLVLEIGPGRGALTRRLLDRGARVFAIELDPRLAATLSGRLGNPPNLTVVEGDARKAETPLLAPAGSSYKVVGNLPYYAANPILRRFLEASRQPSSIVVTLQEEVARNIAAAPGKMGFLSVAVQYYATPRLVCTVPPTAFRPPPKVTSAVVRLEVLARPAVEVADREAFFAVVKSGFSAPRKQLRNSLAQGLGVPPETVGRLLEGLGMDGSRRPATLSLDEWSSIYSAWERFSNIGNPGLR
jgi:16S rRNA (adenine1518-N6/adenine1519-N6)-dimethyltransferase